MAAVDQSWLTELLKGDKGDPGPAGPTGPAGTGTDAQKIRGVNVDPTAPTVTGSVLPYNSGTASYGPPRQLTTDDLAPAFSVSLALSSGGGTFEVGATITPAFNATPATNAGTVTGCTIQDNQGNGPTSVSSANPLPAPSGGGHTYSLATPGSVVVTVTETQVSSGVTRSGAVTAATVQDRLFFGVGTAGATSTGTFSGGTCALVGATGTLTGALVASVIGATSPGQTPSAQKVYVLTRHTSTAHTFKDQNGFVIPFNAPSTFSANNQQGLSISWDLYESTTVLTYTSPALIISVTA